MKKVFGPLIALVLIVALPCEAFCEINDSATEELLRMARSMTPEQARRLIERGADIHAANNEGDTPLILAARSNRHPEVISILVDAGAIVNEMTAYPWKTALIEASYHNANAAVIKTLVENGATVDFGVYGEGSHIKHTPPVIAISSNQNPAIVRYLIENFERFDIVTDGESFLHAAVYYDNLSAMRILLDMGVTPDARGAAEYDNRTALMQASQNDNIAAMRLLLERGADINAIDNRGRNVLMKIFVHPFISDDAITEKKVTFLLDAGVWVTKDILELARENEEFTDTAAYMRMERIYREHHR
ncbi:MAG: ankyrin repeat domain-containing protein [Synergistaceae bacterium]|jgi:ankyrin repeat protein|nr:ankyrin repeat domain-containing protein [Synergistaceae bacterium]